MADEILKPEDVNTAVLKEMFDDAYMETSIDTDGDVKIKEKYSCYLRPDPDGRLVAVYAIFGSQENAAEQAKLDYVNRVNDRVKLIRASVMGDGRYFFDYYIPIDGGITKKGIVLAVRRFLTCVEAAMSEDSDNVVA